MPLAQLPCLVLPFLAPIPAGHEVLVLVMRQTPQDQRDRFLVLDQITRIIYCDERLWGAIGANQQALLDPVAWLTHRNWIVDRQVVARVSGAMVTTTHDDTTEQLTRIFLDPLNPAPYR